MSDRQTQALLLRVAGRTLDQIAEEMGVSKARAHQLVQAAASSGRYKAYVGANKATAEGLDPDALAAALREYVSSLGIADPTKQEENQEQGARE